jgi:hypothetical protein
MNSQAYRLRFFARLARVLALGAAGSAALVACEGSGVSGPAPTSTASMALVVEDGCSQFALGDDQTCRDDLTWREVAEATCAQDDLALSSLGFAHPCGPDRFQAVEFSCCPAPATGERERERRREPGFAPTDRDSRTSRKPVEAAVATCESELFGSDSDCRYPEDWADLADAYCRSADKLLGATEVQEACGDGRFRFLEFSCCPAAQPDPDPAPECFAGELGGETLCKDAATWFASATVACGKWGAAVEWSELGASCGEGLFSGVSFNCCENRALEPGQCYDEKVGSPEACEPEATWKSYAETVCNDRGADVMAFAPMEHCGTDGWRSVSFSCCAQAHANP